uniref:Protein kinase domain-containing protein n=1 Tax=Macrostomum lignano TaxID=282301 RepID=A0A1I8JR54_9PLAT
ARRSSRASHQQRVCASCCRVWLRQMTTPAAAAKHRTASSISLNMWGDCRPANYANRLFRPARSGAVARLVKVRAGVGRVEYACPAQRLAVPPKESRRMIRTIDIDLVVRMRSTLRDRSCRCYWNPVDGGRAGAAHIAFDASCSLSAVVRVAVRLLRSPTLVGDASGEVQPHRGRIGAAVGLNCGPKRFAFDPCLVHLWTCFTVSPRGSTGSDPNGLRVKLWSVPGIYDCHGQAIPCADCLLPSCALPPFESGPTLAYLTVGVRYLARDAMYDSSTGLYVKIPPAGAERTQIPGAACPLGRLCWGRCGTVCGYPPPPPPDLPKVPPPALSTWWILAALALAIGAIGLIVLFGVIVDAGAHSTKAYIYAWRLKQVPRPTGVPFSSDARKILRPDGSAAASTLKSAACASLKVTRRARAPAGWPVNFLKGGIRRPACAGGGAERRFDRQSAARSASNLFGSLDLGDRQRPQSPSSRRRTRRPTSPDTQPLTVYGRTRRVYAHSFGCYGLGAAQRRAIGRGPSPTQDMTDGKPLGLLGQGTRQRGVRPPCSDGLFTVPAAKADARFLVSAAATPPAAACWPQVLQLAVQPNSCSFNNVYQPDPVGKFVAFSGFYHVADFFNLTANRRAAPAGPAPTSPRCPSWWTASAAGRIDHRQRAACPSQAETRTDNKLAWPLGYMILQSASSPTEGLIWAVPLPLFICLIVLFVLLLALAVLFACIALRTSRGKRKGYKPF